MSALLNRQLAAEALAMLTETIPGILKTWTKRKDLYILILDPALQYNPTRVIHTSDDIFTDPNAVLAKLQFGDRSGWEKDYRKFARAKAAISWRTQKDTQELQQLYPHLFLPGEVVYAGGVCRYGIVAAASGVEPYFDHMFAAMAIEAARGLCQRNMEKMLASKASNFPLPHENPENFKPATLAI